MKTKFDQCVDSIVSIPRNPRIDRIEAERIVELVLSKLLEENLAMQYELSNLDIENKSAWTIWSDMIHFIIDRDHNLKRNI